MRAIDSRIRTFEFDISKPCELPKVDATIVAGVIQYVFDDDVVADMLERITSPIVWVRSTCSLDSQGEKVVRDGYASFYRMYRHSCAVIATL